MQCYFGAHLGIGRPIQKNEHLCHVAPTVADPAHRIPLLTPERESATSAQHYDLSSNPSSKAAACGASPFGLR